MKNKKIKNKTHNISSNNESTLDRTLKSSLWGVGITIGISLAILLLGTAIAISTPYSLSLIEPIGYVSAFLTAFLGGFVCSKLNKRSPYLTSVICGCEFVIISMLASFVLPHTFASGMNILTRLLLYALSVAMFPIGAFAGIKGAKKIKPKKKKRR